MRTLVCTTATVSYLPWARILAERLAKFHPELRLTCLFIDPVPADVRAEIDFDIVELPDIVGHETAQKMRFLYTPFELSCAVRGPLHRWIHQRGDIDRWIFLDSDIWLTGRLDDIFARLDHHSMILTAHGYVPVAEEMVEMHELQFLRMGLYNGGFLALRRDDEMERFTRWFANRLTWHCAIKGEDQLWLNFAPLFFRNVEVLDEPGVNVAHWNLHRWQLEHDGAGRLHANGKPVAFLHFSGWDPLNPDRLSKYRPDDVAPEAWIVEARQYAERLRAVGVEKLPEVHARYPYLHFRDGQEITLEMRRTYGRRLLKGNALPVDPFEQSYLYAPAGSDKKARVREMVFSDGLDADGMRAMLPL